MESNKALALLAIEKILKDFRKVAGDVTVEKFLKGEGFTLTGRAYFDAYGLKDSPVGFDFEECKVALRSLLELAKAGQIECKVVRHYSNAKDGAAVLVYIEEMEFFHLNFNANDYMVIRILNDKIGRKENGNG